jgi:hypothetical protein
MNFFKAILIYDKDNVQRIFIFRKIVSMDKFNTGFDNL